MTGYMYILECFNGLYYTGSTVDLEKRFIEHKEGKGSNFTKKNPPLRLAYFEEYSRIDQAFRREKQVQGWGRAKKEALIRGECHLLPALSECQNHSHSRNHFENVPSTPLRDRKSKNNPN